MNDLISRQAAIDAMKNRWKKTRNYEGIGDDIAEECELYLKQVPSAQPKKRTEERTETHACDYINRKDAIDAHYEYCNKHPDAGFPVWSLKILKDLPSAQPGITDEQAILHLQTSGWMQTHDKEMYEMGLREKLADDSDSYDALLPSAQPDIIRCRNCKFASGDSRICMKFGHSPIGELDFCAWAERRTDG